MYREPVGALKYPFLVPGSGLYPNQLWGWNSWLSDSFASGYGWAQRESRL